MRGRHRHAEWRRSPDRGRGIHREAVEWLQLDHLVAHGLDDARQPPIAVLAAITSAQAPMIQVSMSCLLAVRMMNDGQPGRLSRVPATAPKTARSAR